MKLNNCPKTFVAQVKVDDNPLNAFKDLIFHFTNLLNCLSEHG